LGGKQILLDAGEPCSQSLLRMGEDVNRLDAVVISHTHSDHVGGLPMLLQTMWLKQRSRVLPIWMPRRAIKPLRAWLNACYLFDEAMPFRMDWRALSLSSAARIGPVRMHVFRTSHVEYARAQLSKKKAASKGVAFDAYSILLEAGGKRVAYSADIGDTSELAPLCTKPLDVLIVELAHFDVDQLVKALRPLDVKHVIITHMGSRAKQNLRAVRAKLRSLKLQRVTIAKDSDVVEL
jgi:ribonuclease BN (tRNA processing enzyme)